MRCVQLKNRGLDSIKPGNDRDQPPSANVFLIDRCEASTASAWIACTRGLCASASLSPGKNSEYAFWIRYGATALLPIPVEFGASDLRGAACTGGADAIAGKATAPFKNVRRFIPDIECVSALCYRPLPVAPAPENGNPDARL